MQTMIPQNIETELSDLETRHKRHQQMLEDHRLEKLDRRDRHRNRHRVRKIIPILL